MSKRVVDDTFESPTSKEAKAVSEAIDNALQHLFETVDVSSKTQRRLLEQKITCLTALLSKERELAKSALPNINKGTQKILHKFCLWYHGFHMDNGITSDWTEHFTEDSLDQFANDRFHAAMKSASSTGILEENLERVLNEVDIPERIWVQLATLEIKSLGDLFARKDDLEMFALPLIKKTTHQTLLKICLWHEDQLRKKGTDVNWEEEFSDDVFARFEQEPSVERDYRAALDRINEGKQDGGISNVSTETIEYAATITTRYLSKKLVEQCKQKFNPFDVALKCHEALMHPIGQPSGNIHVVAGKTQSGKSTVKAVCVAVHRQLKCYLIIITKGVPERDDLKRKLNDLLSGCRETMEAGLLVIADTGSQIAKGIKAVKEYRKDLPHGRFGVIVDECDAMYRTADREQVMEKQFAGLMNLQPSFRMEISATPYSAMLALEEEEEQKNLEFMEISTNTDYSGISEMKHLENKNGKQLFLNVRDLKATEGERCVKGSNAGLERKTPVLLTEEQELNKACNQCQNTKSRGCPSHTDVADTRFTSRRKSYLPYTTAPMMEMFNQFLPPADDQNKLVLVSSCDSVEKVDRDTNSDDSHSDDGAVSDVASDSDANICSNESKVNGSTKEFTGDSCNKCEDKNTKDVQGNLSSDGVDRVPTKTGLLALVATNPRVYADGNVIQQAAGVQDHFRAEGRDFIALAITGRGIYFRLPGYSKGRFIRRKLKTVSDVIEQLDMKIGLDVPMIIFGYSRMCRCVSFRSSSRVPTHIILSRGPGYSLEDYIQAIGRATFNGLSTLKKNGHDNVTILTSEKDFQAAQRYYKFLGEISSRIKPGVSPLEAIRSAEEKLPDEANFFRTTNRKIGRRKDLKLRDLGQEMFEEPSCMAGSENTRELYWEDKVAQRVFYTFLRMAVGENDFGATTDTILEEYTENFANEEDIISKSALKAVLAKMEKEVTFEKQKGDYEERELMWKAKSLTVLRGMLNEGVI